MSVEEPTLANNIIDNLTAASIQTEDSLNTADENVSNHIDSTLPKFAEEAATRRCGNINLTTLNLNEEEEKVLSEMMASSPGDCNVS